MKGVLGPLLKPWLFPVFLRRKKSYEGQLKLDHLFYEFVFRSFRDLISWMSGYVKPQDEAFIADEGRKIRR